MRDRQFVLKHDSKIIIKKMTSSVSIRDVESKIVKTNKYITIILFLQRLLHEKLATAIIIAKIHLIDDFVANLFLDNDVMTSQSMMLDI